MSRQYFIYSIDALDLIYNQNLNLKLKDNTYILDLSKYIPSSVSIERRDDNELFYQMCLLLGHDFSKGEPDQNILLKKIVVVDFARTFTRMGMEKCSIEKITQDLANPEKNTSWGGHLSRLLDSASGITIKFSSKEKCVFVPFDKSASMAKKSRITYVAENIKKNLDRRLCLDIDFSEIPLSLSKYYAYRGLYLTCGARVEFNNDLYLSEESVIVLPDIHIHPSSEYEGTPLVFTQKENAKNDKPGFYRFEVRKKKIEATAFDGEGLVSPEFAKLFQEAIGYYNTNCFQFRMPFAKGMLFCGKDFQEFFKEFCNDEDPVVKDYLGIPRHLRKAHIIMCESVFKCHDWLREYCENHPEIIKDYNDDPMRFYFDKCRKYDHSIYISEHSGSFCPDGTERLNYQFLDTLKLSQDGMTELIKDHMRISMERLWVYINPFNSPYDDFAIYKSKPYIEAACINPAFYSEERVWSDVLQQMRNMRLDVGIGKLYTRGEHRYLSSDLLAYLLYIVLLTYGINHSEFDFDNFYATCPHLLSNHFYMPQGDHKVFDFSSDRYCAIFRNPHLSRNEECIMRIYIPDPKNDLYEEYFGELTGAVMIPINSLLPNICSGGDFDGDEVKIYFDSSIVNAIQKGGYDKNGKRKLPVVDIPVASPKKETPTNDLAFKALIINTFSSFIGRLSNLSVVFADTEYNFKSKRISPQNSLCAETAAVTGLEIDSVKNNGKPRANISYLARKSSEYGKNGYQFIKCKNAFSSVRGYSYKKVSLSETKYEFNYSTYKRPLLISKPKKHDHSIMLLPYYFAKFDEESADKKYLLDHNYLTIPEKGSAHFVFEENGRPALNKAVLSEVEKLITAYLNINKDIKAYNKSLITMTKSYPKLRNLISLKYDSFEDPIIYNEKSLDISIEDALDNAITLISSYITSTSIASAAIDKIQNEWLFSLPDNRLSVFCDIVGIEDTESVSDDTKALLFDFSFNGFYFLYYIIEMIYSKHQLSENRADNLRSYVQKENRLENPYYSRFLEKYEKTPNIVIPTDQNTSEEDDFDEMISPGIPDDDIAQFAGWRPELNRFSYTLLKEITSEDAATAKEDIDLTALKYTWCSRKCIDTRRTFFWEVIPRRVILKYVKEV